MIVTVSPESEYYWKGEGQRAEALEMQMVKFFTPTNEMWFRQPGKKICDQVKG